MTALYRYIRKLRVRKEEKKLKLSYNWQGTSPSDNQNGSRKKG